VSDDSAWERYGIAAGILFVVLVVIAALIGGAPPKPTDSTAKIGSYFHDNQDALKVGGYLNGLAAVAFLLFLGSLWARLRRVEGVASRLSVVALSGGIAALGLAVIADAINSYVALYIGDLGPGGAKAFYLLAVIIVSFAAFGLAVFVSATSVMILRHSFVERWLGWIGLAIAGLWFIAGIGVADNNTPIHTLGFIAFLLWAGWLLVLAVLMLTRELPADATQA
jgi:MFS family permease